MSASDSPTPSRFERYYTVEEANALLPELRTLLTELQAVGKHLRISAAGVRPILQVAKQNGGGHGGSEYLTDMEALNRRIQRLTDLGIELKDLERGLIDFPAWREDREVFLCWHLGEDHVAYWHDLDAGFSGREQL